MGVWFIIRQPVHPALSMVARQSQQAWSISAQLLSPLLQVRQTPLGVISQRHMPMVKLQQQTTMPFIIMQQLHMQPLMVLHRFCTMVHAAGSSQVHVIFMPPLHFSILNVQRGTIIMLLGIVGMLGVGIPMPALGEFIIPGMPIVMRSIIGVLLAMFATPSISSGLTLSTAKVIG